MRFLFAFFVLCSVASAENLFVSEGNPFAEIENRVKTLEARVDLVERDMDALKGNTAKACPCPDGPCICGKDCTCPDCPEHGAKAKSATITAIIAGASWCGPCQKGDRERRVAGLIEGKDYIYFDVDKNPDLKAKYHVDGIPALILLGEGGVKEHHVGLTGMTRKLLNWLGKSSATKTLTTGGGSAMLDRPSPVVRDSRVDKSSARIVQHDDGDASDDQIRQHLVDAHGYSWSQVSGMSRSQLKAAHDRGHGGPARVAKNYPVRRQTVRYAPTTYYRPSYGYCPNCRN